VQRVAESRIPLRYILEIRIDVRIFAAVGIVFADADEGITVTVSSLTVTNSRKRTVLNVVPDAFPATRYSASRDLGDNSVVEYVQVCLGRFHAAKAGGAQLLFCC
jgi:hypothetical protein